MREQLKEPHLPSQAEQLQVDGSETKAPGCSHEIESRGSHWVHDAVLWCLVLMQLEPPYWRWQVWGMPVHGKPNLK